MRKWRFIRPAGSPLTTTALAFVIAAAAHILFLLPDYRTPGDDTDSRSSSISMLNVSALPEKQQKKFQDWLSIHDPARAARSDSPSGYSAVLPRQNKVEVEVKSYRPAEIGSSVSVTAFSPVPVGKMPEKSLPAFPETAEQKPSPRRAEIFDDSGRKLADLIGDIPANWGSGQPTVIRVTGFGNVSGVAVTRSCGRLEMDRAAQAAVIRMNLNTDCTVTVVWPEVKK